MNQERFNSIKQYYESSLAIYHAKEKFTKTDIDPIIRNLTQMSAELKKMGTNDSFGLAYRLDDLITKFKVELGEKIDETDKIKQLDDFKKVYNDYKSKYDNGTIPKISDDISILENEFNLIEKSLINLNFKDSSAVASNFKNLLELIKAKKQKIMDSEQKSKDLFKPLVIAKEIYKDSIDLYIKKRGESEWKYTREMRIRTTDDKNQLVTLKKNGMYKVVNDRLEKITHLTFYNYNREPFSFSFDPIKMMFHYKAGSLEFVDETPGFYVSNELPFLDWLLEDYIIRIPSKGEALDDNGHISTAYSGSEAYNEERLGKKIIKGNIRDASIYFLMGVSVITSMGMVYFAARKIYKKL